LVVFRQVLTHHRQQGVMSFASKGDDRETPERAISDVSRLLNFFLSSCTSTKGNRNEIQIYDPYYCKGTIKHELSKFGFHNVYNEPVDFYQAILKKEVPCYDILLTNPPYSGRHIRKAMEFACRSSSGSKSTKPWCMLLPSNVYLRDWYEHVIRFEPSPPLFLCPHERYSFVVPTSSTSTTIDNDNQQSNEQLTEKGKRKIQKTRKKTQQHTPYVTMLYIGGLLPSEREALLLGWKDMDSAPKLMTTLASTSKDLPRRVRKLTRYKSRDKGERKEEGGGRKRKSKKQRKISNNKRMKT
jgi:hypothetical protein